MTLPAGGYFVAHAVGGKKGGVGQGFQANFKLGASGEYLALIAPNGRTVVDEFAPSYPRQLEGWSFGVGSGGKRGYLEMPTPGGANGKAESAPLFPPSVEPSGGSFVDQLEVVLGCAGAGVEIRYTLDGSLPTIESERYVAPLDLSETTHLRTAVFRIDGGKRGEVTGAHYLKLSSGSDFEGLDAPADFTSDLPIIVIENFAAGNVPPTASRDFQAARMAVYDVDSSSGRSGLKGEPVSEIRIGLRERGQSSSKKEFLKRQYRVELRDESDEDLDYPLLGLPAESDWVFHGPWADKSLIRNALAFSLGAKVGITAPRARHFELFLNTDGDELRSSDYKGVYVLLESVKVTKERVDLVKLKPEETVEPEVTGGYLMRFDPGGFKVLEPTRPTRDQARWIRDYMDGFLGTLGWRKWRLNDEGSIDGNSETGYPSYIDVDSFVNLMIVVELLAEADGYVRSDYMYKDRGEKLHKGPLWDFNVSAGVDERKAESWIYQRNRGGSLTVPSYRSDMFVPLMRDPNFRQQFNDRWSELRQEGILCEDDLFKLIDELADPLSESAKRNFVRWPILQKPGWRSFVLTDTWEEQVDEIKHWLHARMAWIDGELPDRVRLAVDAGVVEKGREVELTGGMGRMFYTLDGSDPRLPGGKGAVFGATELAAFGTVRIERSVDLVVRCVGESGWSAPSRATYVVGEPATARNLIITELNYHPLSPTVEELEADPALLKRDGFEFIEVRNVGDREIDLSGVAFVGGVKFRMPVRTILAAGAYGVIVECREAFETRYGTDILVMGEYAKNLNNGGEQLHLVDVMGVDIARFRFEDGWFPETDGTGWSLRLVDDNAIPVEYGLKSVWKASRNRLGSPGRGEEYIE